MDLAALDFAAMTPDEFASLVKQTPRRELDEAMAGPMRRAVLDEVFARMASRLRAERAASLDAVIHWHLTGAPGGGEDTYQQHISGGSCTVGPIAEGTTPRLTITTDAVSFLKLVSGNASGPALFMTRKLKLAGDLGLGAGLTGYFDIPKA